MRPVVPEHYHSFPLWSIVYLAPSIGVSLPTLPITPIRANLYLSLRPAEGLDKQGDGCYNIWSSHTYHFLLYYSSAFCSDRENLPPSAADWQSALEARL